MALYLVFGATCGARKGDLWGGLGRQEFVTRIVEVNSTSCGHIACLKIPLNH